MYLVIFSVSHFAYYQDIHYLFSFSYPFLKV
nr:MAG TPA: hypothetical protein [Caudoviricetes sp.]